MDELPYAAEVDAELSSAELEERKINTLFLFLLFTFQVLEDAYNRALVTSKNGKVPSQIK
jgi:hypothetical protein